MKAPPLRLVLCQRLILGLSATQCRFRFNGLGRL